MNQYWRVPEWFPDTDSTALNKLFIFRSEILKFSTAINLISYRTTEMMDLYHFSDSIIASRIIYKSESIDEIYDIGSGNGFPGVVFSILYPNVRVILVEQDERKSEFLKHVVSELGLPNLSVLRKNVENIQENTIKFAVSRAFASITKSLVMTRKAFANNGIYFHMKGDEWAGEVASIPSQVCTFWRPALVENYHLPIGDFTYSVVKTTRIS